MTGESLAVRPTKIVAGQDAESTNLFLQMIAKAVQSKVREKAALVRGRYIYPHLCDGVCVPCEEGA